MADKLLPTVSLTQAYQEGAHVLCDSSRIRRHLLDRYGDSARASGARAWQPPRIETVSAWAERQYQRLLDDGFEQRVLLRPAQCALVWEAVIGEWMHDDSLLAVPKTARGAAQAARLVAQWLLPVSRLASHGGDETRAFVTWLRTVNQRFEAHDWLSPDALLARIADALVAGELGAPRPLVLALRSGPMPPNLAMLVRALGNAGYDVRRAVLPHHPSNPVRVAAPDPAAEEELAARWAWSQMTGTAPRRIAIAAPRISERDETLQYQLGRLWRNCAGADGDPLVVAGVPPVLADSPLVDTALLLLELAVRPLPLAGASALVRSPFLPLAEQEYAARAQLDGVMHASGRPQVPLMALIGLCTSRVNDKERCPGLARALSAMATVGAQAIARQTLPDWSQLFARLLAAAGWPGTTLAKGRLAHDQGRFQDLLPALGQLGTVVGVCSMGRAWRLLSDLSRETVADRGHGQARIHLLNAEDAAAMDFDALWMLGAHDGAWPPAPLVNPFLPVAVAREARMPGTSAEDALRVARHITTELVATAPDMVVSHALFDAEQPLRVSPLFKTLPLVPVPSLPLARSADRWPALLNQAPLETLADERGPVLALGTHAPGGTAFIAAQAACPFRAFATHRLGIRGLESPVVGIDFRTSGDLIHDALCRVWERLKDSRGLAAAADLDALVTAAVAPLDAHLNRRHPHLAESRLLALELHRIKRLVVRWLEFERDRREAPFTVVSLEQTTNIHLGPLTIRVRADRIDRLDDGRLVVIDYKTGASVSAAGWERARIDEPQVPLYAVSTDGPVAGAALAHVRGAALAFKGVASEDGLLPKVKADKNEPWQERLARWQAVLHQLADEAHSGVASVTPSSPAACNHCPLPGACRIEDSGEGLDDEQEEPWF